MEWRAATFQFVIVKSRKLAPLITGVTGQDGAYLAEYLLGLDYTVRGIKCRSSSFNTAHVDHLYEEPSSSGSIASKLRRFEDTNRMFVAADRADARVSPDGRHSIQVTQRA